MAYQGGREEVAQRVAQGVGMGGGGSRERDIQGDDFGYLPMQVT